MYNQFISTATLVTIIVGVLISCFYLHYMWGALRKSIKTRNDNDDGPGDRFHFSLIGAIVSIIVSILSIAIYGMGPAFLYWGPILALLAAVAVAYALREEVNGPD